jgi:hypothetical protein
MEKKCPYKSYGKNQWSALKSKENIKGSGEDTLQLMELVVSADTALSTGWHGTCSTANSVQQLRRA